MWQPLTAIGSVTNTVTLPHSGVVDVVKPQNVELSAFINNVPTPLHHLHVKEGDTLYFKLDGHSSSIPSTVSVSYDGGVHTLDVSAPIAASFSTPARSEQILNKEMENKMMKEDINIFGGSGAGSGAMGTGLGAGV